MVMWHVGPRSRAAVEDSALDRGSRREPGPARLGRSDFDHPTQIHAAQGEQCMRGVRGASDIVLILASGQLGT